MISRDQLFSNYMPNRIIPGFPYPVRYCPFCEAILKIYRAVHIMDQEENFKAVMICDNQECGSYDLEAKEAYCRVYYSSQFAYETLELIFGPDPRALHQDRWRKD